MNTYSIGSDSPRWWWPSAAAGAVGAAAIAAILVLPASSSTPGGTTPADAPAPPRDSWFSKVDPTVDRQCFAIPARRTAWLDNPTCGQRRVVEPWSGTDGPRPGLDSRP